MRVFKQIIPVLMLCTGCVIDVRSDHGDMEDLESGVYVYDIEKRLFNVLGSVNWDDDTSIEPATPDDVETILYGVFTVNEDITL